MAWFLAGQLKYIRVDTHEKHKVTHLKYFEILNILVGERSISRMLIEVT